MSKEKPNISFQIEHRKEDDRWRAWYAVFDFPLTDFITREEMVKYIQSKVMERAKGVCEMVEEKFPDGFYDKNGKMYWNVDKLFTK